nr:MULTISPECIES: hypothetical protein [Providencia]
MSNMKTEVIVIRLTKQERALLDSVKTKPLLADWMKEIALSEVKEQENKTSSWFVKKRVQNGLLTDMLSKL